MPDFEELRLRVTLQDEASAQLTSLRTELSQLGAGSQGQGFERVRRQSAELTQIMRPVAQGSLSVRQGLSLMGTQFAAAGVAVAALGYAFYNQVQRLKEFATQITNLNAQARALGISGAQFESIKRQLEGMGISGQRAEGFINNFVKSIADLSREGSQLRQRLMSATSDPEAMRDWINRMTGFANQGDIEGAMNEFVEGANRAFEAELQRTGSRIMAADLLSHLLKGFNVDDETFQKISGRLTALTEEERQQFERRYQAARQYEQEYNRLAGNLRGFWREMNTELLGAFTEILAEFNISEADFARWGTAVGGFFAGAIRDAAELIRSINRVIEWVTSLKDKTAADIGRDIVQAAGVTGAGGQPVQGWSDWLQGRGEALGRGLSNAATGLGQIGRELFGGQAQAAEAGQGEATFADRFGALAEMQENTSSLETQTDQMRDLAEEFSELNDSLQARGGGPGGAGAAEARALGGTVYAGRRYVVGERGPELFWKRQEGGAVEPGEGYVVGESGPETFVPRESGTVIPNTARMGGLLSGAAPWAAYGAAIALEGKVPGIAGITHATMRGTNPDLAQEGLAGVLRGVIPGIGGLEAIKRDAAQGHPMRTQLRALLGLEDPGEPAPWQQEGGGGSGGALASFAERFQGEAPGAAGAAGLAAPGGEGGGGSLFMGLQQLFAPQAAAAAAAAAAPAAGGGLGIPTAAPALREPTGSTAPFSGAAGGAGGFGGGGLAIPGYSSEGATVNLLAPTFGGEGQGGGAISFFQETSAELSAERQEADRKAVDRISGGEITSRVEGEGTVNVDVGDGGAKRRSARNLLFKKTAIHRQSQMEQAEAGPATAGSAVSEATTG
jgi:hypothetical protein